MYSRDDRDRNCDQSWKCKKCIIPCKSECHGRAYCEQCRYGYKNIVERLKERYTKEELEILNDMCVYVEFALEDIEKKELKDKNKKIIMDKNKKIINVNGIAQRCDKCGSDDLEILTIKSEEISVLNNSFVFWCNECENETLEDKIKLRDINGVNFWIDN